MPFSISKEYHFSASHQLTALPEGHPCHRLHGHNYIVVVTVVTGQLDPIGMVLDYAELDTVVKPIIDAWDHRHLNDFLLIPTAEMLAEKVARVVMSALPSVGAFSSIIVDVCETPKTKATFTLASLRPE